MFEVLGQRGGSLWLPLGSKITMWWRRLISLFVSLLFHFLLYLGWMPFSLFVCLFANFNSNTVMSVLVARGQVEGKGWLSNDVVPQPHLFLWLLSTSYTLHGFPGWETKTH